MQAITVVFLFSALCSVAWADSECINNGTYYPVTKRCFSIGSYYANFQAAMLDCINSGGNLASVRGAFENMYFQSIIAKAFKIGKRYWVGGNSFTSANNYWSWTDNSTFSYTAWALYQPQNSTINQCLGVNYTRAEWYADDCFASYPYICELPLAE